MKKVIAIASIVAFALTSGTAFASHWSSSDVTVSNNNSAFVGNSVVTSSNTGANVANGGDVGASANGAFNDGNDADGGDGGTVNTGDASSSSSVGNVVNSNATDVDRDCGCRGDVRVRNQNRGAVLNGVQTGSDTGWNDSNGGTSGASANGLGNDDNTAEGGKGGSVTTGNARSRSGVVNVVNTNLTRVR